MQKLISLLTILLLSHCAYSQISIGFKAGVNSAWQDYGTFTPPENADVDITGYSISLLAYGMLSNRFSLGIEPGYTQRGAACVPGWQPIFEGDTKFYLDYVNTPVYIAYHLPLFSRFRLNAKLGYGPSVLVSASREESQIGEDFAVTKTKMPVRKDQSVFNRIDHGIYSNLGITYVLNGAELFIETGFYHGFVDAEKFNTSKNRSLNASVGFLKRLAPSKTTCKKTEKKCKS